MNTETEHMHEDEWERDFPGRCDICTKPKSINEVHPGMECGWKFGYVCFGCSPIYDPKIKWFNTTEPDHI